MDKIFLVNFPVPYQLNENRVHGLLMRWPDDCEFCRNRICFKSAVSQSFTFCQRGIFFRRVTENFIVGGFIPKGVDRSNKSIKKAYARLSPTHIIELDIVNKAIINFLGVEKQIVGMTKEKIINRIIEKESAVRSTKQVIREIERACNQILEDTHDLRQILTRSIMHMHLHLRERYNTEDEDKYLEQASFHEKAIFYACKLLESRLELANCVKKLDKYNYEDIANINLHQLIVKLVRIYQFNLDNKNIKLKICPSNLQILSSYDLLPVIFQALLDNGIKYAPNHSQINIAIEEERDFCLVKITSLGPIIYPEEKELIFEMAHRGKEAVRLTDSGIGFGLYAARKVATKLEGSLEFIQESSSIDGFPSYYSTTFILKIPQNLS